MIDATDQMLLAQIRTGDREAFGRLVDRHYELVYRVAFKWCGNQADAEDIAQEVTMKLAGAIAGFEGRSAFTSWLYRLTLNATRDFQRARGRHDVKTAAFAEMQALTEEPVSLPDEQDSDLWQAVAGLPDKQRDAIMLVYSEELSHAAAAEIMGCKESTVSWHIHEAKKKLKHVLQDSDAATVTS